MVRETQENLYVSRNNMLFIQKKYECLEIFEDTQEDEVEDEVAEEGIKGESIKDNEHCNDDSDYDDPVQDELNASGIGKGTYGGLRGGAPTTRRRKPKDGEKAGEKVE